MISSIINSIGLRDVFQENSFNNVYHLSIDTEQGNTTNSKQ